MSYDTPFEYLEPSEIQTLSEDVNLNIIYIDCLAMLHDILSEFSSSPEKSVFVSFGRTIGATEILLFVEG